MVNIWKREQGVGSVGMSAEQSDLEPMPFAGAVTYGNYFPMPRSRVYRVRVEIQRPQAAHPASVEFEYRNDANGRSQRYGSQP